MFKRQSQPEGMIIGERDTEESVLAEELDNAIQNKIIRPNRSSRASRGSVKSGRRGFRSSRKVKGKKKAHSNKI